MRSSKNANRISKGLNMKKLSLTLGALALATSVQAAPPEGVATEATKRANAAVAARLPIADQADFENARRGFLAKIDEPILNADGSGFMGSGAV